MKGLIGEVVEKAINSPKMMRIIIGGSNHQSLFFQR
jgi:hypothetical protein